VTAIPDLRLCLLTEEPLDPAAYLATIADARAGGHDLFVGTVRDHAEGRSVVRLEYSAHPTALALLEQVAREVLGRHEVIAAAVGHRVGALEIGDAAVVCAVSAAHREAAFAACRELIDELKARVPIWKHEFFSDGTSVWVGSGAEPTSR
jgi:molybdopterin synthase catalytic subunit